MSYLCFTNPQSIVTFYVLQGEGGCTAANEIMASIVGSFFVMLFVCYAVALYYLMTSFDRGNVMLLCIGMFALFISLLIHDFTTPVTWTPTRKNDAIFHTTGIIMNALCMASLGKKQKTTRYN